MTFRARRRVLPSKGILLLLVAFLVLAFSPNCSEAKGLRMRVLGASAGGRGSNSRNKPWDADKNRNSLYEQRWEDELEDEDNYDDDVEPKDLPCVGLCYFMKLQRLERKKKKLLQAKNGIKEVVLPGPKTTVATFYKLLYATQEPCIGLCYHYRKLGVPNPYEDIMDS